MSKNKKKWIFIFLLPTVLLFGVVYLSSVGIMFGTAFTKWNLQSTPTFVFLDNFIKLFQDSSYHIAFWNTIIWVVLQATLNIAIGVIFALILMKKEFYWKFARTVYMIPNVIPSVAVGMLYLFVANPKYGIVNTVLKGIGLGAWAKNWFFDYDTAFFSVTMTWLPFAAVMTLLTLAEIASISESIIESAKMDGATDLQVNIFIILPLLKNVICTGMVLASTSMLKYFDVLLVTTNGAPGETTMSLPLYLYRTSMLENNFGYANAQGVAITVIGIVLIACINTIFKTGETD